ncbi:MAG: prepilin peptidase, partial [Candidatus Pacebacteria bacterium]|nr:prepilin peptidase [Candidatus Paceibacterota bacterium]
MFMVLLLGLVIGSFLNVVILRREAGRELTGRSGCMHCGHTLAWYELIPVLSYLAQRGRCRACHVRISAQYPLVECATAVIFVAVFQHVVGVPDMPIFTSAIAWLVPVAYQLSPRILIALLFAWAIWSMLIVVVVYDVRTKLIPDRFNIIFAVLALCAVSFDTFSSISREPLATLSILAEHLLAGALLFLPFYLLWKISDGRWIGLGDGKLAVGIGFLLGIGGGFSAVMFGFWVGAVVMLAVIGLQHLTHLIKKGTRSLFSRINKKRYPPLFSSEALSLKSEIPFGPFLVIGTAIVYFTG